MPTLAGSNIPSPKSWDEFEDIALSAAKLRWKSSNFFRHGRGGQRQDGVDFYGTLPDGKQIGLQGKNTISGVSQKTVSAEVLAAESFQPPLDELYIVTTAKRDAPTQKAVRMLSAARAKVGKFTVDILFWDDIVQDLLLDLAIFRKHYPELVPVRDSVKEHDQALAEELLALLPSNGIINFLDQNNMAGFAFPYAKFDPLRDFAYDWDKPEKEFIDPELEEAKSALRKKVDEYVGMLSLETYPTERNVDFHTVPPEWEIDQPERFWKVVNRFHYLAGEVVDQHRVFVRTVKRVLIGTPKARSKAPGKNRKPKK
jgi:hypothetical protein